MQRNYLNISAEGQDDGKLCWAASMSWWTRATNRVNRSQVWVQEEFEHLWVNGDGTLGDSAMKEIISYSPWRMYRDWYSAGGPGLTRELLKSYLNFGPVFIGFYDNAILSPHVNVI